MTKSDLRHPAWDGFVACVDANDWESFKAGWEASASFAGVIEDATPEFSQEDEVAMNAPPRERCARCPDPNNPSPEFHTTGLAHTTPKAPKEQNRCRRAENGWKCTREARHEGPCAAVPDGEDHRTPEQVIAQRKNAVGGGCCERFGDQMGCDCLRNATDRKVNTTS